MLYLWRLRVLLFYAMISIFTIVFFTLFFIPTKILKLNYDIKYKFAKLYSYIFIWIAKFICGLNYKVSGLEKLPNQPSIVVANHQSFWDNVFMQIIIPKHSWIIKRELFNIPFFGWGLKIVEPIAVDRSDSISVKQILREGEQKIKQGLWLIVFPESTRLKPNQTTRFKPSAIRLAASQNVPIVMLAHNAGVYWPKGFWVEKPGTIEVKVIDVIAQDLITEDNVREVTEHIGNIINKEKQILFEKTV